MFKYLKPRDYAEVDRLNLEHVRQTGQGDYNIIAYRLNRVRDHERPINQTKRR